MEKTEQLIEALREELQQYGEMLALLDQQQDQIVRRAASDILFSVDQVNAQCETIQRVRDHRLDCQRELAERFQLPQGATLVDLIKKLLPKYQPLVQALLQENNRLLFKVQQRARQNHLLFSHSLKMMEQVIASLLPCTATTVYNGGGGLATPVFAGKSLYEAVG
jgi:hypothetical protein